ncbi:hypothetical protein LOC59_13060 [Arthrobacter sp. zg-Y916]|uniref:Uncharacterized protein n=1 Tax=Arthrobacter caoxuetaonis TaxID=2886935 RepID=A0A9X1MGA4_9MICC|nr:MULTISPECIES: hypothetical protein [Arthrobacter]MCC3299559.1 hypothetical protein [Arthrobacter caoxuetaonis]MCC9194569.1 hypothetical protein [Arthrobacter sp. zg-Y916]USQ57805.1 hypothetical protein NF551_02815 [Arthrobacter caoxuetaonis]
MGESEAMVTAGMILFVAAAVGGIAYMLISGIAAYKGTWRTWAGQRSVYQFGKQNYLGFFGLYLQPVIIVAVLLSLVTILGAEWVTDWVLVLTITPLFMVAFACCFRLPRIMLPAWYKDWLDRGADKDEVLKPEYSSPFSWLRKPRNVHR